MNRKMVSRRLEEQMRRASSWSTERIARRHGNHFPMWIGCGYPKSGTVWLCKLMSSYLGVPYPQNYALPIAMQAVVHAHWDYDSRLPKTAYISRDGRDVLISMYFHQVRTVEQNRHPRQAKKISRRFEKTYGSSFDAANVTANLPRFIEMEMRHPANGHVNWPDHVTDWVLGDRPNVSHVT